MTNPRNGDFIDGREDQTNNQDFEDSTSSSAVEAVSGVGSGGGGSSGVSGSGIELTERLTNILVDEGDGDLLLQLNDREDRVLQWLQALDMQVMGACRADERLKPLLKPNVSTGAVEDNLLAHLSQAPPCLPNLSSYDSLNVLGSLRLGKYTEWFHDVFSTDISDKCEDVLSILSKTHGCQTVEIVIPELHEMRTAHLVSIGSEALCSLNPYYVDGKGQSLTYDTRTSMELFRSFTGSDYVAAQCLRRRIMHHHMEIFKSVDVIVTPTTGMTAPIIPPSGLKHGESNMQVTGYLMRFIIAANLLGLPAISVPVGYDKQGLPIGLQFIGRPWGEASVLRFAYAVEELCKSKKQPALYYDLLTKN